MSWRMSTRSARGHDGRWWLSAAVIAGLAAGLAYLLDPHSGNSRRTRISQRSAHVARRLGRASARRMQYLWLSTERRARHRLAGAPPTFAEGRTLLDRVESELFTDPAVPHGALSLEVEGTTVVLRGQLEKREEIDKVEKAVRKIPGVGQVKNLLHQPGTPAPNKIAALIASSAAAAEERWPKEPPPDVDSEDPITGDARRSGR